MSSRFSAQYLDDDGDILAYGRWLARKKNVMRGRPAQRAFRELIAALEALPSKRLIAGWLCKEGEVCALGAMAYHRRVSAGEEPLTVLQALEHDAENVAYDADETANYGAHRLDMTYTLAWVISERNDEDFREMTPEQRWSAVYQWATAQLRPEAV